MAATIFSYNSISASSATTVSTTVDVSTNTNNRVLAFFTGDEAVLSDTISGLSVTCGGTTMNQWYFLERDTVGREIYCFELPHSSLSTGTNTVTATWTTSTIGQIAVVSLYDADQGDLSSGVASSMATATDMTVSSIPATIGDLIIGVFAFNNATSNSTYGTGQTNLTITSNGGILGIDSKTATAESESLYWSNSTNSSKGALAFAVPEYTGLTPSIAAPDLTDGVESSFTTTNFNSVTSADIDGYSLSIAGNTTDGFTYTINLAADTDLNGDACPPIGSSATLTVYGTDTDDVATSATATVTISPTTDWAVVTVGTPDKTGEGTEANPYTLAQNIDSTLAIITGSGTIEKLYYNIADVDTTVDSALAWQSSTDNVAALYYIDGVAYAISIDMDYTIADEEVTEESSILAVSYRVRNPLKACEDGLKPKYTSEHPDGDRNLFLLINGADLYMNGERVYSRG